MTVLCLAVLQLASKKCTTFLTEQDQFYSLQNAISVDSLSVIILDQCRSDNIIGMITLTKDKFLGLLNYV